MVLLLEWPELIETFVNGKLWFCFDFIPLPSPSHYTQVYWAARFLLRSILPCHFQCVVPSAWNSFASQSPGHFSCKSQLRYHFFRKPSLASWVDQLPPLYMHTPPSTPPMLSLEETLFFLYAYACFLSLPSKTMRTLQSLLSPPMS